MKILLINKMEVTVSDDRSWNQSFKESKEAYKKMHQENDKRIIEKHAKSIEKKKIKMVIQNGLLFLILFMVRTSLSILPTLGSGKQARAKRKVEGLPLWLTTLNRKPQNKWKY